MKYKIIDHLFTRALHIQTPESYAMSLAINILEYLEHEHQAQTPNTGWKNNFGLAVAIPHPIQFQNLTISLSHDGEDLWLIRAKGSKKIFFDLCNDIIEMLNHRHQQVELA